MKKISFSVSMFALAATVAFLFMACQKEQSPASTDQAATESNTIVGVNGGSIPGLISTVSSDALRAAYIKANGSNSSQYIQFQIQDLINYLNAMKQKYNSDLVYVNFGVYDANTVPAGKTDYIGRQTVFFSVNNKKKSGGNIVVNGDGDADPQNPDELNHGTIFP